MSSIDPNAQLLPPDANNKRPYFPGQPFHRTVLQPAKSTNTNVSLPSTLASEMLAEKLAEYVNRHGEQKVLQILEDAFE